MSGALQRLAQRIFVLKISMNLSDRFVEQQGYIIACLGKNRRRVAIFFPVSGNEVFVRWIVQIPIPMRDFFAADCGFALGREICQIDRRFREQRYRAAQTGLIELLDKLTPKPPGKNT